MGLIRAIFAAVGLAASLIARGLSRALTALVWALGVVARYLIRVLWWATRVGVPALGRGARGLGRLVWPRLVIAVALPWVRDCPRRDVGTTKDQPDERGALMPRPHGTAGA